MHMHSGVLAVEKGCSKHSREDQHFMHLNLISLAITCICCFYARFGNDCAPKYVFIRVLLGQLVELD